MDSALFFRGAHRHVGVGVNEKLSYFENRCLSKTAGGNNNMSQRATYMLLTITLFR